MNNDSKLDQPNLLSANGSESRSMISIHPHSLLGGESQPLQAMRQYREENEANTLLKGKTPVVKRIKTKKNVNDRGWMDRI